MLMEENMVLKNGMMDLEYWKTKLNIVMEQNYIKELYLKYNYINLFKVLAQMLGYC